MAPVVAALSAAPSFHPVVVNAGQHREMLAQVIDLFGIAIDEDLAVMQASQSLAGLTSRLVARIDEFLERVQPDFSLVQGDTTTVMCAALASFYRRVPIGHVEAGLRTGDLRAPFPEEANRRLVTPLAALHFCPTARAQQALQAEGVDCRTIVVTGNTVIDALLAEVRRQEVPERRQELRDEMRTIVGADYATRPILLVTGHRRENLGRGFEEICRGLAEIAARLPELMIVYPVHLNPRVKDVVHQRLGALENVRLIPPQPYAQFVALAQACRLILTDSGGVQEEAPSLGKPVLVMRDTTERPEGVAAGAVRLVGADAQRIVGATLELLADPEQYAQMAQAENPYGDGLAAGRIVKRLESYFNSPPDAS